MQGLGEVLLDNQSKNFARQQLIPETASELELFALCPLIADCPVLKKVYTYNNKNVSKIKIKYYV